MLSKKTKYSANQVSPLSTQKSRSCPREDRSFLFARLEWDLSSRLPVEMDIQIHSLRNVVNQPLPHRFARVLTGVPLPCRHNDKGTPLTNLLWTFIFSAAQDFGQMGLGLGNRPNTTGIVN